ncbi:hypothetical protein HY477_01350 [Candidatus Uhrbacteria bacterium]|nr:hypothetical protein [Candidatus Uhrbacteria bacterium]
MAESKWEKFKKHDTLQYVSIDEIIILLLGFLVFLNYLQYRIHFIIIVILWYWLKIRHYERKIIEEKKEIYNIHWRVNENLEGSGISAPTPEQKLEPEKISRLYDLEQLENKRKFLVDKFVVLNLILIVLIELFIQ